MEKKNLLFILSFFFKILHEKIHVKISVDIKESNSNPDGIYKLLHMIIVIIAKINMDY